MYCETMYFIVPTIMCNHRFYITQFIMKGCDVELAKSNNSVFFKSMYQ